MCTLGRLEKWPKTTFRNLKKGVQDFHRKFVLAPADKAANNVVVILKTRYINTQKQELSTAFICENNLLDKVLSLIGIGATWLLRLVCLLMRIIASFLRYTGDINFIKYPISPVLLLILAHVLRSELFIRLTSCLTTIKNHVIKYCETVIEKNDKNLLWPIKISGKILDKLKSKGFLASEL